jgi:hypothetical protein
MRLHPTTTIDSYGLPQTEKGLGLTAQRPQGLSA